MPPVPVTQPLPEDLGPLLRHVVATYPREGCGVILRGPAGDRIVPLENVYDRYREADPQAFPRSSHTAYLLDPRAWLEVLTQADAQDETVTCIFHSHVDVGAYFSAEDRAMAAPEGMPLLPGVSYLVVAVDHGRATAARLFWWEEGDFQERPVPIRP